MRWIAWMNRLNNFLEEKFDDVERKTLARIEKQQNLILKELRHMATTTATRQDLDDAIAQVGTVVTTAFADLQAKIDAGSVSTPEDFSAEVASLKQTIAAALTADPGPAVVTIPSDPTETGSISTPDATPIPEAVSPVAESGVLVDNAEPKVAE